ncbi:MAG: GMC family oxidoreductase N-terminal domain-containing protein, partial [Rhodobacter sp.]|nr:GMC family oxidoreductase N-terminal domain-containing protein [Rhodobacter sp.]
MTDADADFIVIGAGSAGGAVAAGLVQAEAGSVLVIENGPSERRPLVAMPFGLVWLIGRRRDRRFASAPQAALKGRRVPVPRGRMVGGSGAINSMVWFRGRRADFDGWGLPGWT